MANGFAHQYARVSELNLRSEIGFCNQVRAREGFRTTIARAGEVAARPDRSDIRPTHRNLAP
jgi:hypothetical protein